MVNIQDIDLFCQSTNQKYFSKRIYCKNSCIFDFIRVFQRQIDDEIKKAKSFNFLVKNVK